VRRMVPLLVLALAASASASPGKVKKADKIYVAYQEGDKAALAEAMAVLEPALAHKKVQDDAYAHGLWGHLLLEVARGTRSIDELRAASAALQKAVGMADDDGVRDGILEDLKSVQGLLLASIEDDLAAKRTDDAWARLEALMAVRATLADEGVVLGGMEERLLRTAIITAGKAGKVDAALGYHEEFFGEGWFDAGLASMIAGALAEAQRVDDALAFLTPLRDEFPGDARLLRAQVDLHGDDAEAALAAVDGAKDRLWPSVSGALLLADLYGELGAAEPALAAYAQVLELDEKHRDALVRSAAIVSGRADGAQATIDGGELSWREKRDSKKAVAADRAEAVSLLERARELDGQDAEVLELLVGAYGANADEESAAEAREALEQLETP